MRGADRRLVEKDWTWRRIPAVPSHPGNPAHAATKSEQLFLGKCVKKLITFESLKTAGIRMFKTFHDFTSGSWNFRTILTKKERKKERKSVISCVFIAVYVAWTLQWMEENVEAWLHITIHVPPPPPFWDLARLSFFFCTFILNGQKESIPCNVRVVKTLQNSW